jgi:hypothetical protein
VIFQDKAIHCSDYRANFTFSAGEYELFRGRYKMINLVKEAADRELNRAIMADEQANTHYYQILRRFVSSKSAIPEEKLRQPEAVLNSGALKDIDKAWLKLNTTEKKLRNAYMKLYTAYL